MRIVLSILLVFLLVPTYSTIAPMPRLGATVWMRTRPVLLDRSAPTLRRIGRLTWLGGIELIGRDPAFGGFSSMLVRGDRFILLSDGGNIVDFRMDARWRVRDLAFSNLPDGPGIGWQKADRDSESMAIDPATGQLWVGFESYNALWRYAAGFARAERWARPRQMRGWPEASGPESLIRLHDGPFVTISETGHWRGSSDRAAIWFDRDPTVDSYHGFRFSYRPPAGFNPSDATELPGGDLLVLNRRFALPYDFTAILTIVPRADIKPGGTVTGRAIAHFAAPLIHDNFEALAATQEAGQTIIWMASDDNQSILQRSLLLKFGLMAPDKTTAPSRH